MAGVDFTADRSGRRLLVVASMEPDAGPRGHPGAVANPLDDLRTMAAWLGLDSLALGRSGFARPLAVAVRA